MNNTEEPNVEQEPQGNKELELIYLYYLQKLNQPITRKDVRGCNIVIQPEEFEAVGSFEIINSNGELITIDLQDNTSTIPFVIYLEELMG